MFRSVADAAYGARNRPGFVEPCGPAAEPKSEPWQSPHRVREPALQPGAKAIDEMFGLRPTSSTGCVEGLFGLRATPRSVCPTGCVVHDEWHLKHSWYSATGAVSVSD